MSRGMTRFTIALAIVETANFVGSGDWTALLLALYWGYQWATIGWRRA